MPDVPPVHHAQPVPDDRPAVWADYSYASAAEDDSLLHDSPPDDLQASNYGSRSDGSQAQYDSSALHDSQTPDYYAA